MTRVNEVPSGWFYISFCDPDRPKGTQFLGAVIVRADDMASATREAWRLGINPGGEALGFSIPLVYLRNSEGYRERLLSKEELQKMDAANAC